MKTETFHIDSFNTNLGTINFYLFPNCIIETVLLERSRVLQSLSHHIEIIDFNSVKDWSKETDFPIDNFKGWIVRIERKYSTKEKIIFTCELSPNSTSITSDVDTGEYLDSVWIGNDSEELNIGTEDGEMLKYRAERGDWMPTRLKDFLGHQSKAEFSITSILKFGLTTTLPDLEIGEKLYFHYLVATNKRKKSKEYPNEYDISTNFAVDFPKWTLIERLKIEE